MLTWIKERRVFPGALFFLLIAVPLLFWSKLTDCFNLPKIVLTELVVLFLLFIHLIKQRTVAVGFIRPGGLDKSSPYIPIALFFFWSLISIFKAVNIHQSFYLIYQFLIYLIFYFLLLNNLKRKDIEKIILALFLVSFLISLYGILQYFGIDFLSPSRKNSPISTLGNPNFTAEYLISTIPLMLMYGISKFSSINQAKQALPLQWSSTACSAGVAELARLCSTFVILFCLLLTQTRASWLGLFVSLIFIFVMLLRSRGAIHHARKRKMAILTIIPLIIFLLAFSFCNIGRKSRKKIASAFNLHTGSTALRLTVWKDTLRMVKENPVLGVGLGNYNIHYPLYQSKALLSKEIRIDHTHNDYLQLAAETGIVGLFLFLWFLFSIGKSCVHLLKKEKEENTYLIILGITGGLIAVLVNAFFAFPLQNPSVLLNFWLFIGLIGILSRGRIHPTRGLDESSPYRESSPYINKKLIIATYIFLSFLVLRPLIADYCLKTAMTSVSKKRWSTAQREFEKAIFYQPSNIFAHFHYGNLLLNRGRPKEAIREFSLALKLYPNYPQTHSNLAIAYGGIGMNEEALQEYEKAIALNPKRPEFYNNLGAFYYQREKYQEAIAEFQKAVMLEPGFQPFILNLKKAKEMLEK